MGGHPRGPALREPWHRAAIQRGIPDGRPIRHAHHHRGPDQRRRGGVRPADPCPTRRVCLRPGGLLECGRLPDGLLRGGFARGPRRGHGRQAGAAPVLRVRRPGHHQPGRHTGGLRLQRRHLVDRRGDPRADAPDRCHVRRSASSPAISPDASASRTCATHPSSGHPRSTAQARHSWSTWVANGFMTLGGRPMVDRSRGWRTATPTAWSSGSPRPRHGSRRGCGSCPGAVSAPRPTAPGRPQDDGCAVLGLGRISMIQLPVCLDRS